MRNQLHPRFGNRTVGFLTLAIGSVTTLARAEVTNVSVGVTPTCPYGISGCWSGARAALGSLKGVVSMPQIPDAYNCTAEVQFAGPGLPNVLQWKKDFKKSVGAVYGFRGVEVTVTGFLEIRGEKLLLLSTDVEQPIELTKLENKLQYNFRKNKQREPEPEEEAAYVTLLQNVKRMQGRKLAAEIIGPLRSDETPIIEVREGYLLKP